MTRLEYTEQLIRYWDNIEMPISLPEISDETPGSLLIDPCLWVNIATRSTTNMLVHFSIRSVGSCVSVPYNLFKAKKPKHYYNACLPVPKMIQGLGVDLAKTTYAISMIPISTMFLGVGLSMYAGNAVVSQIVENLAETADKIVEQLEAVYS